MILKWDYFIKVFYEWSAVDLVTKPAPDGTFPLKCFNFKVADPRDVHVPRRGGWGKSWSCFQWCPSPPLTRKIFAAGAAISRAAVDFAFET